MKPTQALPKTYQLENNLDLSKDKRLAFGLNLLGLVVFLLSGRFFIQIALILRGETEFSATSDNIPVTLLACVMIIFLTVVVHEGIHGISFWCLTKGKPKFGFKGLYAYAAIPDWYLPRETYFVVALAPLALITIAGVLLMPIVPQALLPFLLIWLVFNFSGSIGDIAIIVWLLRKPKIIYINDFGDGVSIYCYKKISDLNQEAEVNRQEQSNNNRL